MALPVFIAMTASSWEPCYTRELNGVFTLTQMHQLENYIHIYKVCIYICIYLYLCACVCACVFLL